MNPFTQSLLRHLQDRELAEFATSWDSLEGLVIRVFKDKAALEEDQAEFQRIRAWLLEHYPRWQVALQPYWQATRVAGEFAREDPFAFLLSVTEAAAFVNHKRALVTLPAAREALNQFLVDQIEA